MTGILSTLKRRLRGAESPARTIELATNLCEKQRFAEAVSLLTEAYRHTGDGSLARELVLVRHDAALYGEHSSPVTSWPPVVPDLFPGCTGIPEVSRAEFNSHTLASGIIHHGGIIVRGLLDGQQVDLFTSHIRRSFDACARHHQGTATADDATWYSPFEGRPSARILPLGREFAEQGGGVLGADSPGTVAEVLRVAESIGVIGAIEEFMQERPAVSVKKTTLRVVPPTTHTGWHQDGAFLGEEVRSVNMWISLSDCGADAPSLDIIPTRFDHIVPTGVEGAAFNWSVSDTVAERAAREANVEIQHLHFAPGDAVFFDHMNLHRTGVRPGMTKERLAIEWWFFAPSRFPMDQIPILA